MNVYTVIYVNVLDSNIDSEERFIVTASELSDMWFRAYCLGDGTKVQKDKDSEIEVEAIEE